MKSVRRVLSSGLAAWMLFSCLPVNALQAKAAQVPETAEVIETTEIAETAAPAENSVMESVVEAEELEVTDQILVDTEALPDSSELYEGYLEGLFYDTSNVSFLGELARTGLNTQGQGLYDYLKAYIQQVAAGELSSSSFKITYDQILSWGGAGIYDVTNGQSALAAFREEFQLDSVVDALLHDCPYDLYWFDKLGGVGIAGGVASSTAGYKVSYVKLNFKVVTDYQPADYVSSAPTFDTTKISGAAEAAANAQQIVTQYADASDYDKLQGYKDAICERVSYNYSVSAGDFSTDNDPWQLIYVFDNDTTTNVVCEGYSKAFQYLCDQTYFSGSVDCYSITGTLVGSGGHMWNIVTLEGQNYLVDVTNSDSGCLGSNGSLFLAGGTGSIAEGYTVGPASFTYDSDSTTLWGTGDNSILKLAAESYAPNGSEEEDPPTETVPETTDPTESHTHSYSSATTAPTCTEQGYTTYTCSCGDSYVDDYVDATGHTYTDDNDTACGVCGETREVESGDEGAEETFPFSDFEWEVLKLTNAERVAEGLDPLTGFAVLQEAGDIRADELVESFSHTRPDGTACFTVLWEVGLTYSAAAENIASGYRTPAAVVAGWMGSEGHHANIMSTDVAHLGVGENSYNWVQLFVSGGRYTSIAVADQEADPGTSIDDMNLVAVLNSSARGTCYLPVAASYCTGFDPDTTGDQSVAISVLGVTSTFEVHVHDWTDADCTTPKTCTLCSETEGEALGHSYDSAVTDPTCTQQGYTTHTCSVCGDSYVDSYVDALGHGWADATCTAPKTCNVCGATEGSLAPHAYEGTETDPTCTESGYVTWICDYCGDSYITQTQAPLGHTEVADTAVAPTCTESGLTEGSHCSVCGEMIVAQEVVPAAGHRYDPVVTAPTCTEGGYTTHTCSVCGDIYQDAATDAAGHTEVTDKAVPATCISTGLTEGSHCSVCGETIVAQEVVPATGIHNYEDGVCKDCGAAAETDKPAVTISNRASDGKPTLSWNTVAGAKKYKVYRADSKNGDYKRLITTVKKAYTDESAETGKTYYYKVIAVFADGSTSTYSEVVSQTCALPCPVVTATNLYSTGKIKLTWDAVDDASKYEVYRADSEDGPYSKMLTTSKTAYTNSGAKAGETYYYKVVALHENSAANSADSVVVSRICKLRRPTVTTSTLEVSGKVTLSWKAVDGAVKYYIYRASSKDGTYKRIYATTKTSFTNTSTVAGKTYYYRVRAVHANEDANSFKSLAVDQICTLARPDVKTSSVASTGKIKLTWGAVDGAAKYEVWRATSKTGTYKKLTTTTKTSFVNTSAVAGKTYYYKVRAIHVKEAANSAYSSAKYRTCDLAQPVVSVSLNSSGNPKLNWDAVEGATGYHIYRATSKSGTYKRVYTTTQTSFTNSSVTDGQTYYYTVKAIHSNTAANSVFSTVKSITVTRQEQDSSTEGEDTSGNSSTMVWIPTNGGTKYHTNSGCSNMEDPSYVTLGEAQRLGFTACKRCY